MQNRDSIVPKGPPPGWPAGYEFRETIATDRLCSVHLATKLGGGPKIVVIKIFMDARAWEGERRTIKQIPEGCEFLVRVIAGSIPGERQAEGSSSRPYLEMARARGEQL